MACTELGVTFDPVLDGELPVPDSYAAHDPVDPFHSYTSALWDRGPAALGANWQDSEIETARRESLCRTFGGPDGFWNDLFYFDAGHYYVHRND